VPDAPSTAHSKRGRPGSAGRWTLPPVVIVVVVAGVLLTGRASDDMTVAMIWSAAWMGLVGIVCLAVALRRRDLRVPVMGAFLVTATVVGGYLGYTTFVDRAENDTLIEAVGPAPEASGQEAVPEPTGPSLLAAGGFESLAHPTSGDAEVIQDGGRLVLQLRDYETDPGPDLRLYLATDSRAGDHRDLGAIGNVGDKQVVLPEGIDLEKYSTVVIWCRAFSVGFGAAELLRQ